MMLRPAVSQILKNNESYYSLVIAVAKRAREITSDAFDNKLVLDEKPVKTAVDELYNGEYKIIEDQASENNRGFLWGGVRLCVEFLSWQRLQ